MTLRTVVLAATMLASALAWSAPASAETFIAYGTGLTRCEINVVKGQRAPLVPWWHAYGTTDCTAAITQTGQASIPGQFSAPLCSGVTNHCYSGEPAEDDGFGWIEGFAPSGKLEYDVTLRAPDGQGWLGAPFFCTGVGTDNLKCDFTGNVTMYGSS